MKREDCWYQKVCSNKDCTCCIRYEEMKYLMDNSGIPSKKQTPAILTAGVDIEQFKQLATIKEDIQAFVDNGENLYITSWETGNGKTSWAIKLMLKYFDCVWAGNGFNVRGIFVHVPSLLNYLKDFSVSNPDIEKIKSRLNFVDLVIFDDIASSKLTDFDCSQLLSFVDTRTINGLSTIYTGNLPTKDSLEKVVGSRLASRIYNNSTVVEFTGKDRR